MKQGFRLSLPMASALLVLVLVTSTFPAQRRSGQGRVAVENIQASLLGLEAQSPYDRGDLVVTGPGDIRLQKQLDGATSIEADLVDQQGSALPDGRYRYQLRLYAGSAESPKVQSGVFFIENGVATTRQAKRAQLRNLQMELKQTRQELKSVDAPALTVVADDQVVTGTLCVGPQCSTSVAGPRNLSVQESGPLINLYDVNTTYFFGYWDLYVLTDFFIRDAYAGITPFTIEQNSGFVGLGTTNPATPLHLFTTTTGDLSFRVDNQGSGNSKQAAFNFAVNQFGAFTVNNTATSGQEFSVRERLDASGATMSVQGSVEGTQFLATSSREMKADFEDLDVTAVLDNLVAMPVTSWRYKGDDSAVRHIGPVAEDFKQAFELGDGKRISTVDADGVTIVAIQGLHGLMQEKDQRIAELERQNAGLAERLAALEKALRELRRPNNAQ